MLKFVQHYKNVMYIKKNYDIFFNSIYVILKFVTVIRPTKKIIFANL